MTTLCFGSFEPASAPPRLWSDRVDSDDSLEHTLPPLEFEGDAGLFAGWPARSLVGATERSPEGASLVLAPHVDATSVSASTGKMGRGEGASGQVASPSPNPIPISVASVTLAPCGSAGAGSGSPRQAASAPASPTVAVTTAAAAALGGGGLGQEALAPPSLSMIRRTVSPSPMAHTSEPAAEVGGAARAISSSLLPMVGVPSVGLPSKGIGSPQTPSLVTPVEPLRDSVPGVTREEVVAFGGIPDPIAEGRRMSARILDIPEVDDMQQRCAMRAAKLQEAALSSGMSVNLSNSLLHFSNEEIINNANQLGVSLGAMDSEITNSVNDLLDLEAERALETIRNLAAVKPMKDDEIDALGVRVLDNLCADLAPPNHDSEEDDVPLENDDSNICEPGYEDRATKPSKPKRKWKRKIYPDSAVRRSARIRTTKKFHDEL
ncbi:uncharacterized protein LOC125546320 isoform X2 [Triticum urartu]|nr:uncharacterized protein LOC125546320 isoform X2 [Triticum urartu]